MQKNQTEFAYPVEKIHGKISRHSRVIHACTASGAQITYIQGKRDLNAHPVTDRETATMDLFSRRAIVVNARIDRSAETFLADLAAYRAAQKVASTPAEKAATRTFRAYLWSLIKAEIPE